MRILLTGGGTAGHINPALAIANFIKEKEKNAEFLFVGTRHGLEKELVPKSGYDIKFIDVMGLRRSLTAENIKVFAKYVKSMGDARRIIKEFAPDIVIGTGGYVCAPVVKAAHRAKIPTIIHEQNVFPGLAVKMLARDADVTAISFEETKKMIKAKKILLTGNPLRPDLFKTVNTADLARGFGFDDKPIALMFGGSLGAQKMNDALLEMLCGGITSFNLIAATGERYYDDVAEKLKQKGINIREIPNAVVMPYIYDMENVFGAADIIIGRAGAITVSEITALGKAAVLIPSPNVAHNHQEYNARYLQKNGAAAMIAESELCGERLRGEIDAILSAGGTLAEMRGASKALGITNACEIIYNAAKELTVAQGAHRRPKK